MSSLMDAVDTRIGCELNYSHSNVTFLARRMRTYTRWIASDQFFVHFHPTITPGAKFALLLLRKGNWYENKTSRSSHIVDDDNIRGYSSCRGEQWRRKTTAKKSLTLKPSIRFMTITNEILLDGEWRHVATWMSRREERNWEKIEASLLTCY